MKRVLILLAVVMIAANAGGCAHRLRDWFYQGSSCGPAASVVMPQQYAAPTCCPTCTEPACDASYGGQVTYGPVMSSDGAMVAPGTQTFVTPGPAE